MKFQRMKYKDYSSEILRPHHDPSKSYKTLWGYFDQEIKWLNVMIIFFLHAYMVKIFLTATFLQLAWAYACLSIGGLGLTAGAHRLYTHKSYKARLPLRIFLMLAFTSTGQNSLYDWVRDHRVHHKFSETDADPHNSKRGFFFSHCGWLMMKKHPEVLRRGRMIDCSDLLEDPVVRFHQKYNLPLKIICAFAMPLVLSYFCLGWDLASSIDITIAKYVMLINFNWSVNSVAHIWGTKPYDKKISPVENRIVSLVAYGEGWHNYHHTFPWDYKAAEFSYYFNVTTFWIDMFAKIGWAYDLKQPTPELVEKVVKMSGDGSHFKLGHDVIEEHQGMESWSKNTRIVRDDHQ